MLEKWNRLKNVLNGDFEFDEITTRLVRSQFEVLTRDCKTNDDIESLLILIIDFAKNIQAIPQGRTVKISGIDFKTCKLQRCKNKFEVV